MNSDDRIGATLRRLARPWALKVFAGAIVVAALVTVGLVVGGRNHDAQRLSPTIDSTIVASTAEPDTTLASVTTSVPLPTAVTTVAPTTIPPAADLLTRPVIDMEGCTTTWAREFSQSDPHLPYARVSSQPVAIQVFASPSGSINDPYIVVERFFADQRADPASHGDDVNGQLASVVINGKGGGQASWLLPDGSEVYVRDHLFDKAALLEVVRALVPRPVDATVPGFDIAAPAPFGLSLLDETYDPFVGSGGATSGCTLVSGVELRAVLIRGRPVYTLAIYLDQIAPYPPVEMLPDGGGTLAVVGLQAPDEAAAALPTARQAADDDWQRWLVAPRRDEIDPAIGLGFLPVDQSVLDPLAGRHFASLDEVEAAVIDTLKGDLPEAEAAESKFAAEVLDGNLVGPAIVVTKPNLDDAVIIASVWFVEVGGTAPDLTVKTVTTSYRCRGGQLRQPGFECG